MMKYTLQKELDTVGLGRRWGCFATSGNINIVEHELGRKLSEEELDRIIGQWFRLRVVDMCNYKNHNMAGSNSDQINLPGWSEDANPEWHWWVRNRRAALLVAMEVAGVKELTHKYETHILSVGEGHHYITYVVDEEVTINSDPKLTGDVLSKRKVEV